MTQPHSPASATLQPNLGASRVGARTWSTIIVLGLIGQLAWAVENMYLNVFVYETISTDPTVIALLVASSAVAATIATMVIGALSDRVGKRKPFVVAGYIAWGLLTALFGLVGVDGGTAAATSQAVGAAIVAIVALDCIMSFFGSGANDGAFNAWVTESSTPANRGRIDSVIAIMPLIAMLIIFGAFDGMTRAGDWALFFGIIGGVTALTGVVALFLMRESTTIQRESGSYLSSLVAGLRPSHMATHPRLYVTLLAVLILGISSQVYLPYLIIYIQRSLKIEGYAIVLGSVLILASIISVLGGRAIDRIGKVRALLPATGLLIVGLLLMSVARDMVFAIVAGTIMMAGMMLAGAAASAAVRDATPKTGVGMVQGLRMIATVLVPMLIGPFIGAAVIIGANETYEELGVLRQVPTAWMFVVAAGIAVLVVIPVLWLRALPAEMDTAQNTPELTEPHCMTLTTPWSAAAREGTPLSDYPRPQFVRENWSNLNGTWQCAFTSFHSPDPLEIADPTQPPTFDGDILVPFSPETPLSGVGRTLNHDELLWYRREFTSPDGTDGRVLLHFGAVDQSCRVAVNGIEVGSNTGGFLPFTLDITEALGGRDTHEIVVAVRDVTDHSWLSRGKQSSEPGGIWYTPQSGIWQTVWLERVPDVAIDRLILTPVLEAGEVEVTLVSHGAEPGATATVEFLADGERHASAEIPVNEPARVQLQGPVRVWTPEAPFLYDVAVALGADRATSYVGMRSFGVGKSALGHACLTLNGEPYLPVGLLDQGYWPDGGLTAPTDEAMIYDIALAKRMGFTMLRKHIKIEPLRWYYHCDRLGMLVWQDHVNGGEKYHAPIVTMPAIASPAIGDRVYGLFARSDEAGRAMSEAELVDMIEHLRSVTSISMWVPFNEGWGQFDAARIAEVVKALDPSRGVDHASGWHDQGAGDLVSKHIYFRPVKVRRAWQRDTRVIALTEYGGYSHAISDHMWGTKPMGYKRFSSTRDLLNGFLRLHVEQISPAIADGLAATVYTQLSDVEDEVNGMVTYDRKVVKFDEVSVRIMNDQLRRVFAGHTPEKDDDVDSA